MKTLKNKLKTFWKDFREVIANLICIPFLLTTIVVVMLTVGVCKLTGYNTTNRQRCYKNI